ncbi:hypothetical protein ACWCQP_49990 [Streptomyces chartreusis]
MVTPGLLERPTRRRRRAPPDGGHPSVAPADLDDSIRTTARYFQEDIPKECEVRVIAVGGHVFGSKLTTTSEDAGTD